MKKMTRFLYIVILLTVSTIGFSQPVPWINDETDISSSIDISIDGHIYLLTKDGNILKFLRGLQQEFKMEGLDPAFESPTKMTVSRELEFIYILDNKYYKNILSLLLG